MASFPPLRAPGLQCALSLSSKGYFDETKKVRAPVSPLSGARYPPVGLPVAPLDCQVVLGLPAAPCFSLLQGLSTKLLAVGEYSAAGGGHCADAEKSGGPAQTRDAISSNQTRACISLAVHQQNLGNGRKQLQNPIKAQIGLSSAVVQAVKQGNICFRPKEVQREAGCLPLVRRQGLFGRSRVY